MDVLHPPSLARVTLHERDPDDPDSCEKHCAFIGGKTCRNYADITNEVVFERMGGRALVRATTRGLQCDQTRQDEAKRAREQRARAKMEEEERANIPEVVEDLDAAGLLSEPKLIAETLSSDTSKGRAQVSAPTRTRKSLSGLGRGAMEWVTTWNSLS